MLNWYNIHITYVCRDCGTERITAAFLCLELGMYLKYFYLKNSICKTIMFCFSAEHIYILYFMRIHNSILYFKIFNCFKYKIYI